MPYMVTPKFSLIYIRKYYHFFHVLRHKKKVNEHSTWKTCMPCINLLTSYVQIFSNSRDFPMSFQTSFSHGLIPVQIVTGIDSLCYHSVSLVPLNEINTASFFGRKSYAVVLEYH